MDIAVMELHSGDPCYSTVGHVDKSAFLEAVYIKFDEEFEIGDVRHTHQTDIQPDRMKGSHDRPKHLMDDEPFFWFCSPHDAGALPVTVVHP